MLLKKFLKLDLGELLLTITLQTLKLHQLDVGQESIKPFIGEVDLRG